MSTLLTELGRERAGKRPFRMILKVNRPEQIEQERIEEEWDEIEEDLAVERTEKRMIWLRSSKGKSSSKDAVDDAMSEVNGQAHEDGWYERAPTPEKDKEIDTDADWKRRKSGQLFHEIDEANTIMKEDKQRVFIDDRDASESDILYSNVRGDEAWNRIVKWSHQQMTERTPSPASQMSVDTLGQLDERCERVEESRGKKRRREPSTTPSSSTSSSASSLDSVSYGEDEMDEEYAHSENPVMRPNVTMIVSDDESSEGADGQDPMEEDASVGETGCYISEDEIDEVVGDEGGYDGDED